MALFITSLNSGSNGNCYHVGNEHEAVLVDAGISCKETEKRMALLNLSMDKVKAILITHEHTDHVKGLISLTEKFRLPVYITPLTLTHSGLQVRSSSVYYFQAYKSFVIGELNITAFPKLHDATDPHSFIISSGDVKVGVFTDIGRSCSHVLKHFNQCDAAFLESNYDDTLLNNGPYPYFLKNRIRGGFGHLSNVQALEIFEKHRSPNLSHLLLSHLSSQNNSPVLVKNLFEAKAKNTSIVVASRYEATQVFTITKKTSAVLFIPPRVSIRLQIKQLSLFDA